MKQFKLPKLSAEHILYGIAIANALRLAWAYATADAIGNLVSLPGVFGLVLGAMVSVGTAFISGKLPTRLAKSRKALTWSMFIALLIMEPAILAPITMMDMPEALKLTLGSVGSWTWAALLALVPSLVLAGVAIANGGLVEATTQPTQTSQSETEKPKSKPVKVERKHVTDEAMLAYLAENVGATHKQVADNFGITRQAVGARVKKLYAIEQHAKEPQGS
jgi:hypothetical protein